MGKAEGNEHNQNLTVTAAKLREHTTASMVECKRALQASDGNRDLAEKILFVWGYQPRSSENLMQQPVIAPAAALSLRESTGAPLEVCKRALQITFNNHIAAIELAKLLIAKNCLPSKRDGQASKGSPAMAKTEPTEDFGEKDLLGAHLISPRAGYSHHGIYVGQGRVIHYSGLADGLESGPVEEVSVEVFSTGADVYVQHHPNSAYTAKEILQRARSRLGENLYSVFSNNCEHFCLWCITGDHHSSQVDKGTVAVSGSSASIAGLATRGIVSAGGSVAGLSGASVMSGLASAGALVGGGTVAGVGLLAGAPAVSMASLINNTVLQDNPAHSAEEREARATGRVASYVGAGAGVAGSIATISSAGSVAGLSGAGITSGLAAIGSTVGGGMAAGAAIAAAAPVAAAALVGVGIYKIVKWFKD